MKFTVKSKQKNSLARTGTLELPHGTVQTPVFMPVGTQGIVKTLAPWEVAELGAEIILGNTYHLHLRPGEELIAKAGGLNEWSRWNKPILTDSGGYQAYSLGESRGVKSAKTTNNGVTFYSPYDGSKHHFTPESVLDIQAKIGSDIVMPLDDCPPIEATKKRVESAVIRTGEWAKRSIEYWNNRGVGNNSMGAYAASLLGSERSARKTGEELVTRPPEPRNGSKKFVAHDHNPALFGIIQGGLFEDLRLRSMKEIQALPFDGIAVGGVAIASEGKDKINKAVDAVAAGLDPNRPHYLMGVGYPEDLIRAVHRGFDMFDCVLPTRLARHGNFWTTKLTQHDLRGAKYQTDSAPLDPACQCKICRTFSKSYLRHLLIQQEMFALRALSYHNLSVVLNLMKDIRSSVEDGNFTQRYQKYLG